MHHRSMLRNFGLAKTACFLGNFVKCLIFQFLFLPLAWWVVITAYHNTPTTLRKMA